MEHSQTIHDRHVSCKGWPLASFLHPLLAHMSHEDWADAKYLFPANPSRENKPYPLQSSPRSSPTKIRPARPPPATLEPPPRVDTFSSDPRSSSSPPLSPPLPSDPSCRRSRLEKHWPRPPGAVKDPVLWPQGGTDEWPPGGADEWPPGGAEGQQGGMARGGSAPCVGSGERDVDRWGIL